MQDQMSEIANLNGYSLKNSLKVTDLLFCIEFLFTVCACVCLCVSVYVCVCVCTNLTVRAILTG